MLFSVFGLKKKIYEARLWRVLLRGVLYTISPIPRFDCYMTLYEDFAWWIMITDRLYDYYYYFLSKSVCAGCPREKNTKRGRGGALMKVKEG